MFYQIYKIVKYVLLYPFNKIQEIFSYKNKLEYLTTLIEPADLKKATGELRDIQMRYLDFAKELMQIAKELDIKPFMVAGTLLGAVRHKGYIPWDDDIDFGLFREDYDKLINYAKQNHIFIERPMNRYWTINSVLKFEDDIIKNNPNKLIFIQSNCLQVYKGTSLKDFSIVDFFAFDFYKSDYPFEEHKDYLKKIKKTVEKINNYPKEIEFYNKEREANKNITDGDNIGFGIDNLLNNMYRNNYKKWFKKDDFFPLQPIQFEDTEFLSPKNVGSVLENHYGKNWNKLPKDIGFSHHKEVIARYIRRNYN
ncbi:MAG: LicD family protein [Candidatus Gastranaerophilales bacterium]|nr:LicD family protein [Candidatus Gastranaerophilales bacterium]